MSVRVRFDEDDGTLEIDGVEARRGQRVVAEGDGVLVAKLPGCHYYAGQGRPQNYAPAEFVVFVRRRGGRRWVVVGARGDALAGAAMSVGCG